MPTLQKVEEFISKVETLPHDEVIKEFYAEDASIQENNSDPRKGRLNLIENEKKMLSRAKSVRSECIRPIFINGDHVVLRWKFRFEWLNGMVTELEEISHQLWKEDRILDEKFFYDSKQFEPKATKIP